MDVATEGFVDVNGLSLHYLDWGGPPEHPLVLIHGMSSFGHSFDDWGPRWSDRFHVLAYDQRGHGSSDHAQPGGYDSYAVQRLADDLRGFAQAQSLEHSDVLGHSLGACTVMGYAGLYPETLRHAVLVDMGPEMDRSGAQNVKARATSQRSAPVSFSDEDAALAYFKETRPGRSDRAYERTIAYGLEKKDDGALHFRHDLSLAEISGRKALVEIPYLWEALPKMTCPTLVVRGAQSNILSRAIAERMVEALPNGTLVEIPDAAHDVHGDNPEAFEKAVLEFLGS